MVRADSTPPSGQLQPPNEAIGAALPLSNFTMEALGAEAQKRVDEALHRMQDVDLHDPQWCGRREPGWRSYCHPDVYAGLADRFWRNRGDGSFEDATAEVKELIDWFGTYLIDKMGTGSGRTYQNEHLPPKLDRLLVRTTLTTSGRPVTVHVPASLDAAGMEQLIVRLEECDEFFGVRQAPAG